MPCLSAMEARLSPQEKARLQRVYAPQVVAVSPSNAWLDLCALPDGEIRHYGHDEVGRYYLSSVDCGFTCALPCRTSAAASGISPFPLPAKAAGTVWNTHSLLKVQKAGRS